MYYCKINSEKIIDSGVKDMRPIIDLLDHQPQVRHYISLHTHIVQRETETEIERKRQRERENKI